MPLELLIHIMSFCDYPTVYRARRVNKRFFSAAVEASGRCPVVFGVISATMLHNMVCLQTWLGGFSSLSAAMHFAERERASRAWRWREGKRDERRHTFILSAHGEFTSFSDANTLHVAVFPLCKASVHGVVRVLAGMPCYLVIVEYSRGCHHFFVNNVFESVRHACWTALSGFYKEYETAERLPELIQAVENKTGTILAGARYETPPDMVGNHVQKVIIVE